MFSLLFLDVPQHGVHLLAKKHQIFFHHTANFAQHFASFEQFQLVHGVRAPLSRQRHQPIGLVGPQVDLSRAKFLGAGRSMQPHTIFKKKRAGGNGVRCCVLYHCGGVKKYLFVYLVRVSRTDNTTGPSFADHDLAVVRLFRVVERDHTTVQIHGHNTAVPPENVFFKNKSQEISSERNHPTEIIRKKCVNAVFRVGWSHCRPR